MTPDTIDAIRRACFLDLVERTRGMYIQDVRWTGILNALDENSPHAVRTLYDCVKWHAEGIIYLAEPPPADTGSGKP